MIDPKTFAKGMDELRAAHPHVELTPTMARVYYATLAPEMDDEQFITAVKLSRRDDESWPSPGRLLRAHRIQREGGFVARAHEMFSLIAEKPARTDAGYPYWSEKDIRAKHGDQAADAFLIAGGESVFREMQANENGVVFVRRAFVDAFVEKLRVE